MRMFSNYFTCMYLQYLYSRIIYNVPIYILCRYMYKIQLYTYGPLRMQFSGKLELRSAKKVKKGFSDGSKIRNQNPLFWKKVERLLKSANQKFQRVVGRIVLFTEATR